MYMYVEKKEIIEKKIIDACSLTVVTTFEE